MNNIFDILDRKSIFFLEDLKVNEDFIKKIISNSSFLVIGGAGSIGSATVKEIFKRNPKLLHVVDISENNLAELVRDLRSSYGYIEGEFKTLAIDVGSDIYDKFFEDFGKYDYVLNFSALKHVRSEKDPYTLMRMVHVNILNTIKTVEQSINKGVKKYFCVSTDKATNPVNMMGASKRIMELFLMKYANKIDISTARFANVAFSDGSLLHSFSYRIQKRQPIVAPDDIKRYFITPSESGALCLLSSLLGQNLEIFFPKLDPEKDMLTFWEIAQRFLNSLGYDPYVCNSEEEARELATVLPEKGQWACYISKTDTSGEKEYEEFYADKDIIDWSKFKDIGVIKMKYDY
ncbi:MAG: UDP-N-acetylglucosamine 4,6-dehydratase, partial [Spirochaetota bacterium]